MGIHKITSILSLKTLENKEDGLKPYSLLKSSSLSPSDIKEIEKRIRSSKVVTQDIISNGLKKTTLVIYYKSRGLILNSIMSNQIDAVLNRYKANFTSSIHISQDRIASKTNDTVMNEEPMLMLLALIVMLSFIAIMNRDIKVVFICLTIMVMNLIISLGICC